jgi:hypothetical protein
MPPKKKSPAVVMAFDLSMDEEPAQSEPRPAVRSIAPRRKTKETVTPSDTLIVSAAATESRGSTGPNGLNGSSGSTGPQGPNGSSGATGPQGPNGSSGATGPHGSQWSTPVASSTLVDLCKSLATIEWLEKINYKSARVPERPLAWRPLAWTRLDPIEPLRLHRLPCYTI